MEDKEKKYLYLLNALPGMYNGLLQKMHRYAGSFEAAYGIGAEEYLRTGIFHGKRAPKLLTAYRERFRSEERLLRRAERFSVEGIRMTAVWEADYPKRLRPLPDRPFLLYIKGELPKEEAPSAAVIGARRCSDYGRRTAEAFGRELAASGVQIISGMAAGIDAAAQEGALSAGRKSYGVLGSGVNVCYPAENRRLYEALCGGCGGVLSEFPPESPAAGYHFILRNRIIAGLCDVLLVLEAREKSGTAITVEQALSYGKEIFALPGRIDDPLGYGCNLLLKDGAAVLTSPSDVLSFFGLGEMKGKPCSEKNISALANSEKIVYSCLDSREKHIEVLSLESGIPIAELCGILMELEWKGLAASPLLGYYRKT